MGPSVSQCARCALLFRFLPYLDDVPHAPLPPVFSDVCSRSRADQLGVHASMCRRVRRLDASVAWQDRDALVPADPSELGLVPHTIPRYS